MLIFATSPGASNLEGIYVPESSDARVLNHAFVALRQVLPNTLIKYRQFASRGGIMCAVAGNY
jgi:hypothetical protein